MVAARKVFARDGFVHARIADIADEAGVSHGSFYTYFESKQAALVEILSEVAEDVQVAVAHSADDIPGDAIGNLERSTRRYVEAYRRNAPMYVLMEQLVGVDPVVRKIRLRGRRSHVKRVTERIRLQQERGQADPEVDARVAGAALASMITNYCYWAYVLEEKANTDAVVRTLSQMWARAIGLRGESPG
jgi:AcrR family transcriptional regulator